MLPARTQFADSVLCLVWLGCRISQVVLLASFAAMVGTAGHTIAAEPAPAVTPASNEELRQQTIEKHNKWLAEMDERRAVIRKERDHCMREQKVLRDEI